MPHRILIADPDEAFGLMMKLTLETGGEFYADAVTSGALALETAQKKSPDLMIVDLAITDVPLAALVGSVRAAAPAVRIMLIPLGDTLPDEYHNLGAHGIITKPFFIGDLGEWIAKALGIENKPLIELPPPITPKTVVVDAVFKPRVRQAPPTSPRPTATPRSETPPPPSPPPPQPTPTGAATSAMTPAEAPKPRVRPSTAPPSRVTATRRPSNARDEAATTTDSASALERILSTLANDVRADALFVLKDGSVLAQRGNIPSARVASLVELLQRWSKVASELAGFISESYGRFQQLHFEGERYHIYAFDMGNSIMLVVLCRTDVPFGTLRLSIKAASAEIGKQLR